MRFSYNWLNSFFKKDILSPEKLADDLMMHFFEIEEIKKEKNDTIIDIDVLPNRASDCFSHLGIVREISALYDKKFNYPELNYNSKKENINDLISLRIEDNMPCLRYVLRAVTDLKIGESPDFIKERLISCGLKPINNVVDITNYVMLEMGQPLHAFDLSKIKGAQIIVRNAKNKEEIVTLDKEKKVLDNSILVIADKEDPIGIAGIKGGRLAEIDKNTKTIVVESANFDSKTIRRASAKLKIRTDASKRFEHGIDTELAEIASKRVIYLLEKYASGKPFCGKIDIYSNKPKIKKIKLSYQKVESLLGIKITPKKIQNILERLDFKLKEENDFLIVTVPTQRLDIFFQEDLIEEIGRMYGYQNIDPKRPISEIIPAKKQKSKIIEDKIREYFSAFGYSESFNYSFINSETKEIFGLNNLVEMENPVSGEYQYLRTTILPGLLSNLKENQKNFDEIAIFEIGKIFLPEKEKRVFGGISNIDNFEKMKGELDFIFSRFQLEPDYINYHGNSFSSLAKIKAKKDLGYFGKISDDLAKKLKIEKSIFYFEIDLESLEECINTEISYNEIPKFPVSIKDIAVCVPKEVKYKEVFENIKKSANIFLVKTELFDSYQGEGIPKNKKNLGFRLYFQSKEKTLSKEDIALLLERIISNLQKNPNWIVRK